MVGGYWKGKEENTCPLFFCLSNNLFHRFLLNNNIKNTMDCCATLHEECPKHHGHKRDPEVIPVICGIVGERPK
jgi:hypothetical protein